MLTQADYSFMFLYSDSGGPFIKICNLNSLGSASGEMEIRSSGEEKPGRRHRAKMQMSGLKTP